MIAKIIVHDDTRALALQRLRETLAATEVIGPKSNVEFLERLVRHPSVTEASIDTGYLDRHLADVLPQAGAAPADAVFAAAVAALLDEEMRVQRQAEHSGDPHSPWARADAWRLGHPGKRLEWLGWRGERLEVIAHGHDGDYELDFGAQRCRVRGARLDGAALSARWNDLAQSFRIRRWPSAMTVHDGAQRYRFERLRPFAFEASDGAGGDRVVAPMPGRVVALKIASGAMVAEGQELIIMEAMKMEITLRAPRAGTIETVQAATGDFVEADAVLIRLTQS
jgi:3-methylcrotonyl-CoA carboxylase alpha subunit